MEKLDYRDKSDSCTLLIQCGALMQGTSDCAGKLADVFSLLGQTLAAGRISLFILEKPQTFYRVYDWTREGGFADRGRGDPFLAGEAAAECCSLTEACLYGRDDIVRFEEEVFDRYGVLFNSSCTSFLFLPLVSGGRLSAFIGIEEAGSDKLSEYSSALLSLPFVVLGPLLREREGEALKRSCRALMKSKQLYELAMYNARIIIFESDLAKNLTVILDSPYSKHFMRATGFPKVMQDPIRVLTAETDSEGAKAFRAAVAAVKQGKKEASCTIRFRRKGGVGPASVKVSVYGGRTAGGRLLRLYTIFQDVTSGLKDETLRKAENERDSALKIRENELSAMKSRELELLNKHKIAMDSLEFILWEIDLFAEAMVPVDSPFLDTCRKIYGLPADNAAIAEYLGSFLNTQDKNRFRKMFAALRQGRRYSLDVRLPSEKAGVVRIFRLTATPSKSSVGNWDSAVATSYDVTDQLVKGNEYEQELTYFHSARDSSILMASHVNLTLNCFVESIPDVSSRMDNLSYDEIVRQGKGLEGQLNDGRLASELLTRSYLLSQWSSGRTKYSYVLRYAQHSHVQWVKADVRMLENPQTRDVEFFFYLSDVTKNELMSRMLERISGVIYELIAVINPADKTICFIGSPRYEEMQYISYEGYLEDELEQHILTDSVEAFKAEYSVENILRALEGDSRYSSTVVWRNEGGEPLRKMLQYFYLDSDKELILCCITDISEQYRQEQNRLREVEEALQRADVANRAKSDFVSRISHDIRTPIGAVLNLTQFAEEDIDQKDKLSEDLSKIKTSGRFLLSLINDVLDISKIDSGKIELLPEACSYDAFVEAISSLLQSMCYDKGLDCVINVAPPLAKAFMADKVRLNQVTLNLLSNSVKYTPAGGAVSFFLDQELLADGRVSLHICVADNGIGMTEEFQQKMFDEFTQDSRNPLRDKTTPGTGLGLSIVNKMVRLMGGEIKVFSTVGKGSSFLVSIPLKIADEKDVKDAGVKKLPESSDSISATILLAEDNMINTEIAERIFGKMGVDVEHVENGAEAVALFSASEAGHFDAVFMDIQMPKMDGYAATQAIRALDREDAGIIPIVAMTANAFADAVQRAKDAGMDEYVTKPLDPEKLREVLQDLLARRRA